MKKILFLTLFLLISVSLFSQNFNASQSGYRSVQSQNQDEVDLDRLNNENRDNASQTEGQETEGEQQPTSQDLTHILSFRLGFGYNGLLNAKSEYKKDGGGVLLGVNYTLLFLKIADNLRFGLSLNIDLNIWLSGGTSEEDKFGYFFDVKKTPDYPSLDFSLLPVIKYKTLIFGAGFYYNKIINQNLKLYEQNKDNSSDADYTIYKNPKIKENAYGIIAMIGYFVKPVSVFVGVSLEFKFSLNKPILYYDYYNTGTFPYTERGVNKGDGNYYSIMVVLYLGGAW